MEDMWTFITWNSMLGISLLYSIQIITSDWPKNVGYPTLETSLMTSQWRSWPLVAFSNTAVRQYDCPQTMMMSSNGNIFRVTGPLYEEFTGHWWIPHTKASARASDVSLIFVWINGWVNNRESGDLRCHRAHYDVIAMTMGIHSHLASQYLSGLRLRVVLQYCMCATSPICGRKQGRTNNLCPRYLSLVQTLSLCYEEKFFRLIWPEKYDFWVKVTES